MFCSSDWLVFRDSVGLERNWMKTEPVPLWIIFVESTDGVRKPSRIWIVLKIHLKFCANCLLFLCFFQSWLSCDGIPEVSNLTDTNRLWQEDHLWSSCLFVRLCIKEHFSVPGPESGLWCCWHDVSLEKFPSGHNTIYIRIKQKCSGLSLYQWRANFNIRIRNDIKKDRTFYSVYEIHVKHKKRKILSQPKACWY